MADSVADALNELKDTISEFDSVVQANNVLLDNLGEFMRTHANDAGAIRDMGNRLITDKQSISEAIVRNTPADPSAGGSGGTGGTPPASTTPGNTAGQPNHPRR